MLLQTFIESYYAASGIPISVFEKKELKLKGGNDLQDFNIPLYLVNSLPDVLPDIWYASTPEFQYFGGLCHKGMLILLGPVFVNPCSHKQADSIMSRLGRKHTDSATFLHSMEQVPLINAGKLCSNLLFLNSVLNDGENGSVKLIDFTWSHIFPGQKIPVHEIDYNNKAMNDLETSLLSMIRYGKVYEMRLLFNESPVYHSPDNERATSSLNIRRNYILGANGIASREAIKTGCDQSVINGISSYYIDEISKSTSIYELSLIFQRLMLDYAEQVKKLSDSVFDNALANRVNKYVKSHIYEKLSTSIIADNLGVTSSYLSSSFKKITSVTISDFINKQKVKEAMYLLDLNSYTTLEISELLCYSSQSYFGSIFKRTTGMTPLEYASHT